MPKRPIRIVGVSGFAGDPPAAMRRNVEAGPVDAIIGDYLAEFNLAINAIGMKQGNHPGWEQTFMDGTKETLDLINERRLKLVTNGGALNPEGAAEEIKKWIDARSYNLKVAFVEGDNVTTLIRDRVAREDLPHLDGENRNVGENPSKREVKYLKEREIISANCYLGSRAITAALSAGADIVVCGRVADASPVMGLAAWWHGWADEDYDALAGALIAGHLIECSGYSTGGNFSGFERYDFDDLTDIGFPVAEVAHDGTAVLTKQESLPGLVDVPVIACQFLYELQGNIYLNSDVKANLDDIQMEQVGENRVRVTGVRGHPPPPTTKCAIFWVDGYQCEYMIAMTGSPSNCRAKTALFKHQTSTRLQREGLLERLIAYEVQEYGTPCRDPSTQFGGTSFLRIFTQARTPGLVSAVIRSHLSLGLEHFSGYHSTLMTNPGQAVPRPFLGYYPALFKQSELQMQVTLLGRSSKEEDDADKVISIPPPAVTERVEPTVSYDPSGPGPREDETSTVTVELGSLVLARSGDKGGNINVGFLVADEGGDDDPDGLRWHWMRHYLTTARMRALMGDDWREGYVIERVAFERLRAVHFVIYGILGRGVTSSPVLDNLGKGFADYIRSKHVEIPSSLLSNKGSHI